MKERHHIILRNGDVPYDLRFFLFCKDGVRIVGKIWRTRISQHANTIELVSPERQYPHILLDTDNRRPGKKLDIVYAIYCWRSPDWSWCSSHLLWPLWPVNEDVQLVIWTGKYDNIFDCRWVSVTSGRPLCSNDQPSCRSYYTSL